MSIYYRKKIITSIDFDFKFFAILPALNLNFHGGFTLEFEWLFLGIYIAFITKPERPDFLPWFDFTFNDVLKNSENG